MVSVDFPDGKVPKNGRSYAIWSGYQLDLRSFQELVSSIPVCQPHLPVGVPVENEFADEVGSDDENPLPPQPRYNNSTLAYLYAWMGFRKTLPPALRKRCPDSTYRYFPGMRGVDSPPEQRHSHIFFPSRWIPYRGRAQLEETHPDYKQAMTPTQNEEQILAAIVEAVKESGGEIEIEEFEWAGLVDLDYNSGFVTVRLKYFVRITVD
ncbi:uncharacterized protein BXZ73DRAFT_105707 [Epithele typhae]|uniref:uncharacterized protein n=1 Tax=Epithele typhae TaxID=378194 RepID=UPI0020087DAE|nr:uncharacterized protein BXZ73DRAFT_105707 [Epithele typhae]KAH9916729.1 hypothetical protein BXZ73DRAFT_105707 [Epithele typhae]